MQKNYSTAIILMGIAITMVGLSYAAVPLYRMFCQVTGFGGTPQVAKALPSKQGKRVVTVRFNADCSPHLPWRFKTLQNEIKVIPGERGLAFYSAENLSDAPIVGMASYNVTPNKAGPYFNKVECFCFIEQRLEPKQKMDMPVSFFLDPALETDPNLQEVTEITLSYTFFPVHPEKK
jgi:cytochrome c oxidase assembly protein subunit 11